MLCGAAFAQAPLVETIDVRVVNVDVVVTDQKGHRITGLTKDDFELLENEKAQTITNFSEIRVAPVARTETIPAPVTATEPAAPPRRFVLFVDNSSLHPQTRKRLLPALEKFVAEHVRVDDLVSVAAWNKQLEIVQPLTSDKNLVTRAIRGLSGDASPMSIRNELQRIQKPCMNVLQLAKSGRLPMLAAYNECIGTVRIETMATVISSRLLLNAINVTMATMSGMEGKKVLVLAGALLPQRPGMELFQWANAQFAPYMRGFDMAVAREGEEAQKQREMIDRLGHSANAHGVTLYLIAAAMAADPMNAETQDMKVDQGAGFLHMGNTEAAFETLADLTGGMVIRQPLDIGKALDSIAGDLTSYYSLGYRPAGQDRGDRELVVRTKNRAYKVRSRRSFALKSDDDQLTDRVISNIFAPLPPSEIPVTLRTGAMKKEGANFVVPIEISIPATITLLPDGSMLSGGFTVYVAVGNAQGALSTTFRQPNPVRIPAAGEKEFRAAPLVFTAALTVRPGENLLSVGVVDQVSKTEGFARKTIVAK
jgi:VWFA-related protein